MLPQALTSAAIRVEEQAQTMGLSAQKVPRSEWTALPDGVQKLVPMWLRELMETHALLGLALEGPGLFPHETYVRFFYFWSPRDFQDVLKCGDPVMEKEILAEGFIPISNESDGDLWIVRVEGDANSAIQLFSLSNVEKIHAADNLAQLMALMSVSEESAYDA